MLYISKTTLGQEDVVNAIHENKDTITEDYYSDDNTPHHLLPLAVAAYIEGEHTSVSNGYTVTNDMVVYSTCRGNMIGVYKDWSDDIWYFFMSGRRHGIPISYFLEELLQEYNPEDTYVYLSENTSVSPFEHGVEPDPLHQDKGEVWPKVTHRIPYLFDNLLGVTPNWSGSVKELKRILPTLVVVSEEVPTDIADVDLSKILVSIPVDGPLGSIDIDGVTFEGDIVRGGDYVDIIQKSPYDTVTIRWWYVDERVQITSV